jgi:hypothetical protein
MGCRVLTRRVCALVVLSSGCSEDSLPTIDSDDGGLAETEGTEPIGDPFSSKAATRTCLRMPTRIRSTTSTGQVTIPIFDYRWVT